MYVQDINDHAAAVGCQCPNTPIGFGLVTDEAAEFFQTPTIDELADTLVTASRWLARKLNQPGKFFWVPFYSIRLAKEHARLQAHGCIRSARHLVNGHCPSGQ